MRDTGDMMRRLAAIVAVVVFTGTMVAPVQAQYPLPTPPPPQPQAPTPATDPRVAQIKAGLEKAGLKVYDVISRRTESDIPHWVALTAAQYAQPSYSAMQQQALIIWGVMYPPLAGDPRATILSAHQGWNKYGIRVHATVRIIAILVRDYQGAATDAQRRLVLDRFFARATFDVLDLERGQFVDQKDFVNKNFVRG